MTALSPDKSIPPLSSKRSAPDARGTADRHPRTARTGMRCATAVAAGLVAMTAAGAAAAQDTFSFIRCTDGNSENHTLRVSPDQFARWNSSNQTWEEFCFEGERVSQGGRAMTSTCQINENEVVASVKYYNTDYGFDTTTWRVSRRTGQMNVLGLYPSRPTLSLDCTPTSNPDTGRSLF